MEATLELLDILTHTLVPAIRAFEKDEKYFYPPYQFNLGDYYGDSPSRDLFVYVHVTSAKTIYKEVKRVPSQQDDTGKAIIRVDKDFSKQLSATENTTIALQVRFKIICSCTMIPHVKDC